MCLKLFLLLTCLLSLTGLSLSFDKFTDSESLFFDVQDDDIPKAKEVHTLAEAEQAADRMIEEYMKKRNIPAMVFGMSVKNVTVHRSAQGLFDIENDVPADINGMFRMGSVTKTLTSLFIGTLVEAGKLKYEDSIYKHLPVGTLPPKSFNHSKVDITVGQLLSHMSGLHATDIPDIYDLHFPKNCVEAIKPLRDEPLYFKPGTDFVYSNYGYQVLGAIIEDVTGNTYVNAIDSFLSKMAKMPPSSETQIEKFLNQNEKPMHHHSRPKYYKQDNDTKAAIPVGAFDDTFMSIGMWSAGGLISNVDDLLLYGHAILDIYHERPNAVLKKETLLTIWKERTSKAPNFPSHYRPSSEYGYGFGIADVPKRVYRFHPGGLFGVSTLLSVYPEEEIVVVTMANLGGVPDLLALSSQIVETVADFVPKM